MGPGCKFYRAFDHVSTLPEADKDVPQPKGVCYLSFAEAGAHVVSLLESEVLFYVVSLALNVLLMSLSIHLILFYLNVVFIDPLCKHLSFNMILLNTVTTKPNCRERVCQILI